MWQGYLTTWGALNPSLLKAIKPHFLITAKYDAVLGRKTAERYYAQLTTIAMSAKPVFKDRECKQAIASLSSRGRTMIVSTFAEGLSYSQGKDKVKVWDDTTSLFFERVWPREARYQSPDIARQMEKCCDCAGARSKQARELLMPYIQPYI